MARILVADDTKAITDIVTNILQKEGHEVQSFYNGQQAIDALSKEGHFDLVITDMLMPEKDGFDVIAFIKEKTPDTQIVVMTGGGVSITPEEVIRSVGNDIEVFLTKPIGKSELLDAVNQVLA
jgi:CheY-like chemotaxis protein